MTLDCVKSRGKVEISLGPPKTGVGLFRAVMKKMKKIKKMKKMKKMEC